MKRSFLMIVSVVIFPVCLSGAHEYEYLCKTISSLGSSIEQVDNIPGIGKLTNLLPFAVLANSLKECPMQTIAVLAAISMYMIAQNETVRETINTYEVTNTFPWIKRSNKIDVDVEDPRFFVFDEEYNGYDEYGGYDEYESKEIEDNI